MVTALRYYQDRPCPEQDLERVGLIPGDRDLVLKLFEEKRAEFIPFSSVALWEQVHGLEANAIPHLPPGTPSQLSSAGDFLDEQMPSLSEPVPRQESDAASELSVAQIEPAIPPELNDARIEDVPPNLTGLAQPRHPWWKSVIPWEPTTLMSAAGLRGATYFDGWGPLVPAYLREPPFNWPRPGEHTQLLKVVDWKLVVT